MTENEELICLRAQLREAELELRQRKSTAAAYWFIIGGPLAWIALNWLLAHYWPAMLNYLNSSQPY